MAKVNLTNKEKIDEIKMLQLKISLKEKPAIWRRFIVNDFLTFEELHNIIQIVMGWENYHLYEFEINGKKIQCDEEEGFNPAESILNTLTSSPKFENLIKGKKIGKEGFSLDIEEVNKILEEEITKKRDSAETDVLIKKLLNKKGLKFNYTYDFGDSWEHIILIEDIQEKKPNEKLTPVCIEGKNACPPEDCGGIGDYEDILKIRKNKKHPQYKEMIVGWLGEDFDPEKFDIKKVNGRLQKC